MREHAKQGRTGPGEEGWNGRVERGEKGEERDRDGMEEDVNGCARR